jgi:hypothetical protein
MTRLTIIPFGRSFPIQKRVWTFFENRFVPKWFTNNLSNKTIVKGFCFINSWPLLASKRVTLKMLQKTPYCFAKALPFKRHFISNRLQNKYQNLLIWTPIRKRLVSLTQGFLQKTLVSQTCLKEPTSTWDIIWWLPCYSLILRGVRSLWVWDLKWHSSWSS